MIRCRCSEDYQNSRFVTFDWMRALPNIILSIVQSGPRLYHMCMRPLPGIIQKEVLSIDQREPRSSKFFKQDNKLLPLQVSFRKIKNLI